MLLFYNIKVNVITMNRNYKNLIMLNSNNQINPIQALKVNNWWAEPDSDRRPSARQAIPSVEALKTFDWAAFKD
jgi:hypothetical protein